MADKPKRKLRPAQTVREKAKAASNAKPKKRGWLRKLRALIALPFSKLGVFLGKYKLFRAIAKVLCFSFLGSLIFSFFFSS